MINMANLPKFSGCNCTGVVAGAPFLIRRLLSTYFVRVCMSVDFSCLTALCFFRGTASVFTSCRQGCKLVERYRGAMSNLLFLMAEAELFLGTEGIHLDFKTYSYSFTLHKFRTI